MNTQTKELIIKLYTEGKKLKEISDITKVDASTISKLARKSGCLPRMSKTSKNTSKHKCPKCKHIYKKEDNFCSHCGTDVRSKEKLLITDLEWLRGNLYWIHDDPSRLKADEITRDIIKYLSIKN